MSRAAGASTGTADLFRALGALAEPPGEGHERLAAELALPGLPGPGDYVEAFLLQAYPYASVHLGDEGMMGGEARDRVAGFWRALGLVPPPEPDHLAALLGLYAALADAQHDEPDPARAVLRASARRALLWEHLLSWCPVFLDSVAAIAPRFYAAWADLLARALLEEAAHVGRQAELPLALRDAAPLPDPAAGARDWLAALLAPVRAGFVLTRADLARAAGELGLGLRMGERAFALRALFEQDANATLGWLAGQADEARLRHAAREPALGDVARFWSDRAAASADALRALLAGQ